MDETMPLRERTFDRMDAALAAGFALAAFAVYFALTADYVFPGESAKVLAALAGVSEKPYAAYPLLRFFARLFGGGNLLAPFAGAAAVALAYLHLAFFIRANAHHSDSISSVRGASRAAGCTAAALTLFAPAVMTGATHLEPNLFGTFWMLFALVPFLPWNGARSAAADVLCPLALGVLWGLGLAETPLCWWFSPFVAWGVWETSAGRGKRPVLPLFVTALAGLAAYFALAIGATDGLSELTLAQGRAAIACFRQKGWILLAAFSTVPFVLSFFSARRALDRAGTWTMWTYHLALSLCLVFSIAVEPLSPAGIVAADFGKTLPVATSVFAALAAGYLAGYWWLLARSGTRARLLAFTALAVLLPVWTLSAVVSFVGFDAGRGAFADAFVARYLDELGNRAYFVPYGFFSDNLQLAARRRGLPTEFLYLHRDNDRDYAARLANGVSDADLRMSLDLGVYAFSKELMRRFPETIATVGRPGLWTAAEAKAVPGFALFNGEKSEAADWTAWREIEKLLKVRPGWGSREIAKVEDPLERLRLELRRHFGMMAVERAAWLQDRNRDDEAYRLYALALDEIDADNLSALFNLIEMAQAGHAKAKARKAELERRVKAIVDDKARRYRLRPVLDYYGRLRSYRPPSEEGDTSAAAEVAKAMDLLRERKLAEARKILDGATREHPKDMHAWSLLAAVVMQQCDETKDPGERRELEEKLTKDILPGMEEEKGASDFYVLSVRAFLLLRQGAEKRAAARDAFAAAARARPDAMTAQNAVLGMDISLNDPVSAEHHAREILRRDREAPLANYIMGSLALQKGDLEKAVRYLHKGADATNGTVLAANDLAEALRRLKRYDEAERYARLTVKAAPKLYVGWDTLAGILLDRGGDLEEAAACVEKACALSAVDGRPEDIRMLASLARVQLRKGDKPRARMTLAKMRARLGELSEFERGEYDRLEADAR